VVGEDEGNVYDVGSSEGTAVKDTVGEELGPLEGDSVGVSDGFDDGFARCNGVGKDERSTVGVDSCGLDEGKHDGGDVGETSGARVGMAEGFEGCNVGLELDNNSESC
jgi:hypothetical protein